MSSENRKVTLEEAAALVGYTRANLYKVAVKDGRIHAQLVCSCRNGKTRPRWLIDLRAVKAYFSKVTVLRDNAVEKGGAR